MKNSEKTISANSKGIIISYGDANKHQFVNYQPVSKEVERTQIYGSMRKELFQFNTTQKDLYQKIVYGFSAYTKEEILAMSKSKKYKVTVAYTKAHRILNRWKQEIVNEAVDVIFLRMFPKSVLAKQMVSEKGYDDNLECTISFKDLGVSKKDIANKLIEFGLLPENFFNLA
jgi:hypothetical protein